MSRISLLQRVFALLYHSNRMRAVISPKVENSESIGHLFNTRIYNISIIYIQFFDTHDLFTFLDSTTQLYSMDISSFSQAMCKDIDSENETCFRHMHIKLESLDSLRRTRRDTLYIQFLQFDNYLGNRYNLPAALALILLQMI